jgi:glutathione S-transferase
MITLYTFGPAAGLPDFSPFVTKAMLLLKIAGLPYETNAKGFNKAPKGKLPYIDDDGQVVADSTFIRFHIEKKYGVDFDRGLSAEQKAVAWAVEKMLEEHLYWANMDARWCVDANFERGPANFFSSIPQPLRSLVVPLVRRKIRSMLKAHGMGRHTRGDIELLAARDLEALAVVLGDKPYLMGDVACGADASAGAFVIGTLCQAFETPIRTAAERHPNLVAYGERIMHEFFPEFAKAPVAA